MHRLVQQLAVSNHVGKSELIGQMKVLVLYRLSHIGIDEQDFFIRFRHSSCQICNCYRLTFTWIGAGYSNDLVFTGRYQKVQRRAEGLIGFQNIERNVLVVID